MYYTCWYVLWNIHSIVYHNIPYQRRKSDSNLEVFRSATFFLKQATDFCKENFLTELTQPPLLSDHISDKIHYMSNHISVLHSEIFCSVVAGASSFLLALVLAWLWCLKSKNLTFSNFTLSGSSVPCSSRGKEAAIQALKLAGLAAQNSFMHASNKYLLSTYYVQNRAGHVTVYLFSRPQRGFRQRRESWTTRTAWWARKHGEHGGAR